MAIQYLHAMVRVRDLDESMDFYCGKLGLVEHRRYSSDKGRFTNVMLCTPEDYDNAKADDAPLVELTYNWDPEEMTGGRTFGHLAFRVDNIYECCQGLMDQGVVINRPPRDGHMAFIKSPDDVSIELLQRDGSLEIIEPWASMENIGTW